MDNYTMIRGVKDRKNGRIVVENQRAVQAYKNAKGKYLFVCYGYDYDYEYSYYLYIDEDGKILFKKDLETI